MDRQRMIDWIGLSQMGRSSMTMWCALMGVSEIVGADKPYDNPDFDYCIKMVRMGNVTKEDLQKVKERFNWYSPYIDNWEKLVTLYDNNKNHELFELLEQLESESDLLRYSKSCQER